MKRRVRQTDVARLARVSPATVSLVINNRTGGNVRIPAETRKRVLEAVDQLGYVVDPAARSLAGGQNLLLGVFTFESIFPLIHRDFYYRFLVGIEEEAERLGYDLLLFTSASTVDGTRRVYNQGVNRLRMADGAVLLGLAEGPDEVQRLVDEQYPFVFVGRRELNKQTISYVAADYVTATAELVTHMLDFGHRRVIYIGSETTNESQEDRQLGYRLAFERAAKSLETGWLNQFRAPAHLTPAILETMLAEGASGFVIETGPMSLRFVECMQTLNRQPLQDFSVAVLGDPMEEGKIYPNVTSFSIPRRAMGANAVRILVEILASLEKMETRQVTLPCTFVPGSTVGPIR